MRASVFVGTSVDGFIARRNGDFDFLPDGGGEPHGYDEFMSSVDVLVIGRNTYEKVLTFEKWPYAEKRVVVLSSRTIDVSNLCGAAIEHMSGSPAEIADRLAASGASHAYIDGGITVQGFLRARLVIFLTTCSFVTYLRIPIQADSSRVSMRCWTDIRVDALAAGVAAGDR
jgi:dihydrofolate reductase